VSAVDMSPNTGRAYAGRKARSVTMAVCTGTGLHRRPVQVWLSHSCPRIKAILGLPSPPPSFLAKMAPSDGLIGPMAASACQAIPVLPSGAHHSASLDFELFSCFLLSLSWKDSEHSKPQTVSPPLCFKMIVISLSEVEGTLSAADEPGDSAQGSAECRPSPLSHCRDKKNARGLGSALFSSLKWRSRWPGGQSSAGIAQALGNSPSNISRWSHGLRQLWLLPVPLSLLGEKGLWSFPAKFPSV
jgi:hypothetical protein